VARLLLLALALLLSLPTPAPAPHPPPPPLRLAALRLTADPTGHCAQLAVDEAMAARDSNAGEEFITWPNLMRAFHAAGVQVDLVPVLDSHWSPVVDVHGALAPAERLTDVLSVVGDECSFQCAPLAGVVAQSSLPVNSLICTASTLSAESVFFPCLRSATAPSDAAQGQALAHLVTLFGWTRGAIIARNEMYVQSILQLLVWSPPSSAQVAAAALVGLPHHGSADMSGAISTMPAAVACVTILCTIVSCAVLASGSTYLRLDRALQSLTKLVVECIQYFV
jgi:hypothetical protein